MNKSEALNFVNILKQTYPDAQCSLDFNTPFQLAVAVMLSAQCTDERVNKTHLFFSKSVKLLMILKILILMSLKILYTLVVFTRIKRKTLNFVQNKL